LTKGQRILWLLDLLDFRHDTISCRGVVGGKGFESHSAFLSPQVAEQQSETWIARNRESFDLVFLRSAISLVA
jgi:hypothetical protein